MCAKQRLRTKTGASVVDVAQLAAVSPQTVSRVANGSDRVSPQTRKRVLQAMEKVGYTPNTAARALRLGHFKSIGVLTQSVQRTGETLTISGILDTAQKEGYSVTLLQAEHPETGDEHRMLCRLSTQAIDGLIIAQAGWSTWENLALPVGLPVVTTEVPGHNTFSSAFPDIATGTQLAMQHLFDLGHRRIHHIGGPEGSYSAKTRLNGWKQFLEDNGINPPRGYCGPWSVKSGYQIARRITKDPQLTAILCANDEIALGAMRALHEEGLRVPQDVSLVGFDGIELGQYAPVPLTTVKLDFHASGALMVQLLLKQIRGENPQSTPQKRLTPTELVVRSSTASPRNI